MAIHLFLWLNLETALSSASCYVYTCIFNYGKGHCQACERQCRCVERRTVIMSGAKGLDRRTKRSFAALRACPERSEGMTTRIPLKPAHGKPSLQMSKDAVVIVWDESNYGSFEGCCHTLRGVKDVFPGGSYALFQVIHKRKIGRFRAIILVENQWGIWMPCSTWNPGMKISKAPHHERSATSNFQAHAQHIAIDLCLYRKSRLYRSLVTLDSHIHFSNLHFQAKCI